jgi:hypothetical protein
VGVVGIDLVGVRRSSIKQLNMSGSEAVLIVYMHTGRLTPCLFNESVDFLLHLCVTYAEHYQVM